MSGTDKSREIRLVVTYGWRDLGVKRGMSANGYEVSIWRDGNILKLTMVMFEQFCEYIEKYQMLLFK